MRNGWSKDGSEEIEEVVVLESVKCALEVRWCFCIVFLCFVISNKSPREKSQIR